MLVTIRHGQTNYNLNRLYSGINNGPTLLDEAKKEACKKGKELNKYNIDVAYVSPLNRAKETFYEINKSLNIPFIEDKDLIERDFKEYEGKVYESFNYDICWMVEESKNLKVETIDEMVIRIKRALDRIKKENGNKNVLIVAHSGTCRVIRYILEGKKEKNLRNYEMENLHIDVFKEW